MDKTKLNITKLDNSAEIPYNLLLLADETIEGINKYIFDSDVYIATLQDENIPIAVFALQYLNHKEVEIMNIAVAESLQSQGIGQWLIDKAIEIVKEKGYNEILVGTADCGTRQLNFYYRNGFKDYEIKKNYFIEKYSEPIYENGIMLKDMVILKRTF